MPPDIGFLETLDFTETLIIIRKEEARSPAPTQQRPDNKGDSPAHPKEGSDGFQQAGFRQLGLVRRKEEAWIALRFSG
jgi:hypothetical protein